VVPADQVLPTAIEIATAIAANAPLAVALTKEIALDARRPVRPRHRDVARARRVGHVEQRRKEGARAFAEKRPPNFTGT